MMHGRHLDSILFYAIDDAVVTDDDFPDVLAPELRNDPSRARIFGQMIGGTERAVGEYRCCLRCVSGDEQANGFEVIESLRCPLYLSHLAMRWRASSWLTKSPRSAWPRPLSILYSR